VRIEDVDTTRCRPQFAEEILATLRAFGLHWDGEVMVQSERAARYSAVLDQMAEKQLTYACACSRKEIADSAMAGNAGIEGPVYPGTCRARSLPATGNALRVRTMNDDVRFVDLVQGECVQRVETDIGDFILKRRDGRFAYQLAVVVDDADQGVTHVVRGADLLDSTARQIHLQRLLGFATPQYLHFPVVTNDDGQKLSKQTLAPAIGASYACKSLREALRHLGQPMSDSMPANPAECLLAATRRWNVAAIPKRRSLVLAAGG
jgi:glutamyl-Q tRNA(Asp) synthetase